MSLEGLCLKEEDCPSPTQPQASDDEFDTDSESDGKYIKLTIGFIVGVVG